MCIDFVESSRYMKIERRIALSFYFEPPTWKYPSVRGVRVRALATATGNKLMIRTFRTNPLMENPYLSLQVICFSTIVFLYLLLMVLNLFISASAQFWLIPLHRFVLLVVTYE